MRYRVLGETGLRVSELGFGTIPILSGSVPVLPQFFSPDTDTAIAILRKAFDHGCNFFDTAIPEEYGDAEYKLGQFAKSVDRKSIVISDKARFYSGGSIYREVIRSIENLGTEPDIYFVHQVDNDNADEVFGQGGVLDALYDLKREGRIGFTGIASHYYDVLYRGALDPRVDVLQGSGNILERGMLDRISREDSFRSKGLIINKVYAAGLLIGPFSIAELIGGVLEYPFSCALLGVGTFEQEADAFASEYDVLHFSFEEVLDRLRESFEPIGCSRCEKCVCPHGHDISTHFRQFNYFNLGKEFWAANKLSLDIEQTYRHCMECTGHVCMRDCDRNVFVPEAIERIYDLLKGFGALK
jgi:hypothetical protein